MSTIIQVSVLLDAMNFNTGIQLQHSLKAFLERDIECRGYMFEAIPSLSHIK
jgi:hypothetical protein